MRIRTWSNTLAILGLFGGLLALASLQSPAAEEARCVRIGLVSSLFRDTSEALMQIIMRPFKSLLEAQTGMTGKLIAGGDALHLGQRLKEGEIHLGIFHGVEFAWAREKIPQLKPLLIAVNKQPFLRSHLVVRDDGKVNSINDLKGKVIALPSLSREHCWLFLERRCVPEGQTPEKFFSRVSRPRDATYAIDDVLDGVAAAAIIDDADLLTYRQQSPEYFAKVKVLQQSETFPSAVIAYYPGNLSTDLLEQFRVGMLAAKDSRQGRQMMQMCRITSFEEVPDNFEQMLLAIAKAYPAPAK